MIYARLERIVGVMFEIENTFLTFVIDFEGDIDDLEILKSFEIGFRETRDDTTMICRRENRRKCIRSVILHY